MSVRKSLGWTYSTQILNFFLYFGSTIVLARILSPRDFGIFAMVTALAASVNTITNIHLAKLVVREPVLEIERIRSIFSVSVIVSILYFLCLVASAYVSGLLGSAEVSRFLFVYCAVPLILVFEFAPSAICVRESRFGIISSIYVLRAVVFAGVAIALALSGFSYMSFAWATIACTVATTLAYNFAVWRPDIWRWRTHGMRGIVGFGSHMIGISGIRELSNRAGEITLGSLQGLTLLGLYSRAASLPVTLHGNIFGAANNVIFSRMSRELRESGTIQHTYLQFVRLIFGLLWPMMIGFALLSQPLIQFLYGAKWQGAATPLAFLMVAAVFNAAIAMVGEIFILRHQTKRQVKIEVARSVVGYILFAAGAFISLPAAAAAKLLDNIIGFLLYRKPLEELVDGPRGSLNRIYGEALLLTVVAALPTALLMAWHRWSPDTPLLQIGAAITVGVAGWGLLLVRLRHPIFVELSKLVRGPEKPVSC